MDTFGFLTKILPRTGLYVLATRPGDGPEVKSGFDHTIYKTIRAMADAAVSMDAKGRAVYFARSSFNKELPRNGVKHPDGTKEKGVCQKANVLLSRSMAIDLDVGPKKEYASAKDAVSALVFVCKQLSLPAPMLVSSGRGVHAYWVYSQDVSDAEAQAICGALSTAAKRYNLHVDPSITGNLAALLRPVGTHWRKDGEREVRLLRDAPESEFGALWSTLKPFAQAAPISNAMLGEWSTGERTYPPSSMTRIAAHCQALKTAVSSVGIEEPLWRVIVGLAKHSIEGAAWAHAWSRPDPRYSEAHTQTKYDLWEGKPTLCATIESQGGKCDGCAYRGKIKSPIHLGYDETPAPTPEFAPVTSAPTAIRIDAAKKDSDDIPFWCNRYSWNGEDLMGATKNADGLPIHQAFTKRWFYPYARTRLDSGAMALRMCSRSSRGKWDDFTLPTSALAEDAALWKTLAEHEIIVANKAGQSMAKQYIVDMMRSIERHEDETDTIQSFGWYNEGFIVGSSVIYADRESPVILGNRVPENLTGAMQVKGTTEDWARLVDEAYNRPGAEPYQFMILSGFASPLVQLAEADLWHGLPIALTGESGLGKTTTCLVAASIYGCPKDFLISAHEMGTTLNALIARVAVMRNLPLILDELHSMKGADLPMLLYALSNGRPKSALRADRSFRSEGENWNLISFVTSNENLLAKLGDHDRVKTEATQIRIFEIALPNGFNDKVFKGFNAKDVLEHQLLANHYGMAGRDYLRYVCSHRTRIAKSIQTQRAKFAPNSMEQTKERFHYDAIATVKIAGKIAKGLGLVNFDLDAIEAWALNNVQVMRSYRTDNKSDFASDLQTLLSELVVRTVQTKTFPKSKPARGQPVEHIEWRGKGVPIARQPTDSNVIIVTRPGLRELCRDAKIPTQEFLAWCDKQALLVSSSWANVSDDRIYLFRGTDLTNAAAQQRCYIFNLDALDAVDGASQIAKVLRMGVKQ